MSNIEEEIPVFWRAAIVPENGGQPTFGTLTRIGKRRVVVKADRNFQADFRCNLAVMLPKSRPGDVSQFLEGRGRVAGSVMAAMQFHIALEWLELHGNGEALLNEQIRKFQQTWKTSSF